MASSLPFTGSTFDTLLHSHHRWSPPWSFNRWRQRGQRAAPTAQQPENAEVLSPEMEALVAAKQIHTRNLIASSTALALAAVGLTAAPVKLAALPVLLYMGLPAARRAYNALADEAALPALLETVALSAVLVQGTVLPGALGFSLYYLGRTWWLTRTEKAARRAPELVLPKTVCVRRAQGEVLIPTEQVQPQESVVYTAGDLIVMPGIVMEGVAWTQSLITTGASTASNAATDAVSPPVVMKTGATVNVGALVLVGKLVVQVNS